MNFDRSSVSGRYWFPLGVIRQHTTPEPGSLITWDHAIYQVFDVRDLPRGRWTDEHHRKAARGPRHQPKAVGLRPVALADHPDPVKQRSKDRWYDSTQIFEWAVYPDSEHYPVCACCGEPMPCRAEVGRKMAEQAVTTMGRYETAGVCPACEEPITRRQKSLTFSDNLMVLGGPPVTFHLRSSCFTSAMKYEKQWVAADPERRRHTLSCPGRLTNHNDGTYECTQFGLCPGPTASHPSYTVCHCPDCHARPWTWGSGCHPDPKAKLVDNSEEGRA